MVWQYNLHNGIPAPVCCDNEFKNKPHYEGNIDTNPRVVLHQNGGGTIQPKKKLTSGKTIISNLSSLMDMNREQRSIRSECFQSTESR